jgi:hypothetical protein
VQNAGQTVPLVAGKSTFVRVYPASAVTARAVFRARGGAVATAFVRADAQTPIQATLPESWTAAGDLEIDAEISGLDGAVVGRLAAPSTLRFRAASPLRIHYIRACSPECPNANLAALAGQVLPIGDDQLSWEHFGDLFTTDAAALVREVGLMRSLSDADLVVVLRREAFGETLVQASAPLRLALVSTQADGEANVAHAILALLGAARPAHTIGVGDVGWNRLASEAPSARVFWIASDTFAQVFNARSTPPPATSAQVVLNIGGSIRRDGSAGALRPGFRVAGLPFAADPASTTCLRFSSEGTLGTTCFATLASAFGLRMDDEPFAVSLPIPSGSRRVALLRDGRELAFIAATPAAPTVQATASQQVTWTAADADGGALTFRVLASVDGGTPRPLGLELADRQLGIDPSQIPAGSSVTFHVYATDGFNTALATTTPIEIARTASLDLASRDVRTGDILVGRSEDIAVPIRNKGNGPMSVSARGESVRVITAPPVVPPGTEGTLQVRVQPESAGAFTGTVALATNDPDNANVTLRIAASGSAGAAPAITATPAALAFGEVASGNVKELELFIRNVGGATLNITGMRSSNEAFHVVSGATSLTIAPGASVFLAIRFAPLAGGSYAGSLAMTTNDPVRASMSVALTGSAAGPPPAGIEVESSRVDFGEVAIGNTRDFPLGIRNSGSQALVISNLVVQGAMFSILGDRTLTIAPGGRQAITLRFSPTSPGGQTGTLTINSSDSLRPTVGVALVGTGTGTPLPTVLFNPLISDSFSNRIATDPCALGAADLSRGGFGNHRYLPLGRSAALQVSNGSLANTATGFNGFLFAGRPEVCLVGTSAQGVGQDVHFRAEVLLPSGTQAGPIFLARATTLAKEDLFRVGNTGVWVQFHSTGEVKIRRLDTQETLASGTAANAFDNSVYHVLEATVQDNLVSARIDGLPVAFANGSATIPTAIGGGVAAGIGYGSEPTAASGQRVRNMVVSVPPASLIGPSAPPYDPNPVDRPAIEVAPAQVMSMDSTRAGQSSTRTFTMRNNGGVALTVSSIRFTNFQFVATATPFTVGPREERTVTIRYSPTSSGTHTTDMSIFSNDPRRPEILFTVVGTATVVPGSTGVVTLQVDDGTAEKTVRLSAGGHFVNRLKPSAYPSTLRTILIYIPDNSVSRGTDITVVYKSTTASPGSLPGGQFQTLIRTIAVTGQFIEVQIPADRQLPPIASGDFVVGFHIGETEGRPIAVDTTDYKESSFVSTNGGIDFLATRHAADIGNGNFLIRATATVPLQ